MTVETIVSSALLVNVIVNIIIIILSPMFAVCLRIRATPDCWNL